MDQKKLLIAGGGYAEIPLILAAQKMGFYVITSGNREEDLGHKYSNEYHKVDFSDKEKMLELAQELNIGAICPCCNDFSALSCAYVAERLGLFGHDPLQTAEILHYKDNYRMFAAANDILTPKAQAFADFSAAIDAIYKFKLPVIVKPVDLTGGKGITKIISLNEARQAIESAFLRSKVKRVVIEEFIEGTNHGFSTFIRSGKIVFYFVDNEHYFMNKYMVSGASAPGNVPQEAIEILIKQSEKIASLLKLKDGIFHIQFILQERIPYIIEICRRPPGDLYIDLVSMATGIDYPEYIVKAFTGQDISDLKQASPKDYYTRHCIMAQKNGTLKNIIIDESLSSNIVHQMTWWKSGDSIEDFYLYKAGIVFLKYCCQEEYSEKIDKLNELIYMDIE